MKVIKASAGFALALLVLLLAPGIAQAHHATAQVTCAGATVDYVSTQGTRFSGEIYLNDKVVGSWDFVAGQAGHPASGQLTVPYQATGTSSVYASWRFSTGERSGLNRVWLDCPPPPPPLSVTPPPPPPVTLPAVAAQPLAPPEIPRACPRVKLGKYAIVRRGHAFILRGDGLSRIRWYVNGRRVGFGRVHVITRFTERKRRLVARARVSPCNRIHVARRLPKPTPPPLPRFAG
jgi:hypothetical protein